MNVVDLPASYCNVVDLSTSLITCSSLLPKIVVCHQVSRASIAKLYFIKTNQPIIDIFCAILTSRVVLNIAVRNSTNTNSQSKLKRAFIVVCDSRPFNTARSMGACCTSVTPRCLCKRHGDVMGGGGVVKAGTTRQGWEVLLKWFVCDPQTGDLKAASSQA